uniref:Amino acid transporter transmembrane domain-containing protein n=1 Tax=Rhizophora mucronata TaxID=61149 RepID=A0A2P2M7Z1_RHIMU
MLTQKQAEEAIVSNLSETEHEGGKEEEKEEYSMFSIKSILWHGGSAWDAWFSCASNQVAQVLLTLPYSFSQMGMLSGILLQIFYGLMGSWTAYLISVLYIEYRTRKEKENVSFKNHVIQVCSLQLPKTNYLYHHRRYLIFKSSKFILKLYWPNPL